MEKKDVFKGKYFFCCGNAGGFYDKKHDREFRSNIMADVIKHIVDLFYLDKEDIDFVFNGFDARCNGMQFCICNKKNHYFVCWLWISTSYLVDLFKLACDTKDFVLSALGSINIKENV